MTIKELIDALSKYDANKEVIAVDMNDTFNKGEVYDVCDELDGEKTSDIFILF